MANKRRGAYSPNISMPGSSIKSPGRGAFAAVLCLLLPPIGLMFLWRKGVFRTRGRILVTAAVTLEMAVIVALMMPAQSISTAVPIPGGAARFTPAPESDVLTALSNIDELLRQQQAAEAGETYVSPIDQAAMMAEQEQILASTVHAYNGDGSRFYHAVTVCGNQSNLLTLTVEEALAKGLGPCPDCGPPVYSALGVTAEAAE